MSHGPSEESTTAPEIESHEAFEDVVSGAGPVLVDFYTEWCGPCRLMADIVDELAAESERAVIKVDAEAVPELTKRYDIHGVPAFVAFEDGDPVDRLVGMQNKADLRALLDQ